MLLLALCLRLLVWLRSEESVPHLGSLQSIPGRRLVTPRIVFACAIFACPGLAWVRVCFPLPSSTAKLRKLEAEAPYLARVSALSVRPGTPQGLRTSTSSTCLVTWGSAKLPNFELLHSFEDLMLREASEPRFRQHCRGSGSPRKLRGGSEPDCVDSFVEFEFRTLISSTVSRIGSSATPQDFDFVDVVEDLELRGSSAEAQNFDSVGSVKEFELRTLISSTVSRIGSSAKPQDFDFVHSSEDFERPWWAGVART